MTKYKFTFTKEEKAELNHIIQKGGKGYRIKMQKYYSNLRIFQRTKSGHITKYKKLIMLVIDVAHRFVFEGLEGALGRKKRDMSPKFITGEVEARICAIACSKPPEGRSHWTMQMIADELI